MMQYAVVSFLYKFLQECLFFDESTKTIRFDAAKSRPLFSLRLIYYDPKFCLIFEQRLIEAELV